MLACLDWIHLGIKVKVTNLDIIIDSFPFRGGFRVVNKYLF